MASGGKRLGAGRKAGPEGKKVTLSIRVLPSTKAKLQELATTSIGSYIDNLMATK